MEIMKRISVLALLCMTLISVQTASAQVRFGVRGGVDVINSNINSKILNVNNRVGYSLGAALDFRVPIIGIGVESGLQFGHQNLKAKDKEANGEAKITDYNYLTMPLMLKKNFSIFGLAGIYVKGGVYGDFRLGGGKVTANFEDGPQTFSPKSFQKGLAAGFGISLFNHAELGLNYRHRLGSVYTGEIREYNFNKLGRNTWSVTLAYYL